jgi:hypothetical protein
VCSGFVVYNDSAVDVLINVVGLHAPGEFFPIAPATSQEFEVDSMGLTLVRGKSASGTAAIRWGVTSKGPRS